MMAENEKRKGAPKALPGGQTAAARAPGTGAGAAGPRTQDAGFRTHGRVFIGTVVSDRMAATVTVAWERRHYVPKYQRYERRYSKVKAHNPPEIDAKAGDTVTIMETRPISKTKHFIVIKKD
jgi:ribosomal protein uS17